MVFNNYYCSNAYLFEKESVTLHPHTTTITLLMKRKHNPKQISTVLSVIVCLFATMTQTAYAKNIAPQRAAQIAKKYITLPHDNALKAPANGTHQAEEAPYYLFNDTDGRGFVLVAGDDEMAKCSHTAKSTPSTRSTLILALGCCSKATSKATRH